MFRRTTQAMLTAVATMAAVVAAAASAEAATTCKFANDVVEVRMTQHGDIAIFGASNNTITLATHGGAAVTCSGGTPTTANTDAVLVLDDSDNLGTPAVQDGNTRVAIPDPIRFGPGKTGELGHEEIEFLVDTKGGYDALAITGDDPKNIAVGNGGLSWTTDDDADVIGMPFDQIELTGAATDSDELSGQGGRGTGGPLTMASKFVARGLNGGDLIRGSDIPGGDALEGGDGDDVMEAGVGDDRVDGGLGGDTIRGGPGSDTVDLFDATAATVDLALTAAQDTGEGVDTLIDLENVIGTVGADRLTGNAAVNVLDGGTGDDTLEGRGGADELLGGEGADAVSYAQAPAGVTVDLARTTQPGDGDRLNSIEDAIGSPFADTLTGNAVANRIVGGAGADTIAAAAGADLIEVRDGDGDRVSCGDDADTATSDRRTIDVLDPDCETIDALPEPAQPAGPTPDTALTFTLRGASRQRVLRQKAVHVSVSSPLEACTMVATATGARLKLGPLTTRVPAGATRKLKLRLSRRQLAALRKAIRAGRRPTLHVTVQARDAAGNAVRRTLRVTVRR